MLNSRGEQILLSLKSFDYLTTKQLQHLHDLKSDRNAYRVIKQLDPYLNHFIDDNKKVYYLNKKGREAVDSTKIRKKTTTAKHYLMRNDLYIHLGKPASWSNEVKMKYKSDNDEITVVADAYYRTEKHHIIEIDNVQKMHKNKIKIDKYRRLIEKGVFKGMPELIWVTTTPYRKQVLQEMCDGLDCKVYIREDLV